MVAKSDEVKSRMDVDAYRVDEGTGDCRVSSVTERTEGTTGACYRQGLPRPR